jgi:voltage-gated potassium channel
MAGQMLIEHEIIKVLGRRRMDKQLATVSGHYILCGFGRVGRVVSDEFARHKMPFVIIERHSEAIEDARIKGYFHVQGDCTQDDILIAAGIKRAKGLINTVPDVAESVYTTLTARQQNPDLFIMTRADSPNGEQMLMRAGANRVISPQVAAGTRMAMAALRPNVVDFISLAAFGEKDGVRVEEIIVSPGSKLVEKSFKEIDIRAKYGLNVIGIRKPGGKLILNPDADYKIESEDTLIMAGSDEQLSGLDELCRKPS